MQKCFPSYNYILHSFLILAFPQISHKLIYFVFAVYLSFTAKKKTVHVILYERVIFRMKHAFKTEEIDNFNSATLADRIAKISLKNI